MGGDLIGERNRHGEPALVRGTVKQLDGAPIPGAVLDFWQNGPDGIYDVQEPERGYNLRCRMITGEDGRFAFTTTRPLPYTIPLDGPVAKMMEHARRNVWRPAHLHVRVDAPGFEILTNRALHRGRRAPRQRRGLRGQGLPGRPLGAERLQGSGGKAGASPPRSTRSNTTSCSIPPQRRRRRRPPTNAKSLAQCRIDPPASP